jgi:hypothetical protein
MPIMMMGLAVRKHILEHFTGRVRTWGAAGALFAAVLAGVVFIGQIVGKWEEGGWIRLLSFSILFISAHLVLLSPVGYRDPKQIHRIVREKARVQGAMASIVEWQSFRMQEYRYRLLLALSSFLELFGVGQAYRPAPVPVSAGPAVPIQTVPVRAAARSPAARPMLAFTSILAVRRRNGAAHPDAGLARPSNGHPGGDGSGGAQPQDDNTRVAVEAAPGVRAVPSYIERHRLIVPINGIHQGTLTALAYARSLSDDVTAVHVAEDPGIARRLREEWDLWGEGIRLVVLDSPHGMVLEPLIQYIQSIAAVRQPREAITLVVPQLAQPRWWRTLWKSQIATLLRMSLPVETGIVIVDVPYQIA